MNINATVMEANQTFNKLGELLSSIDESKINKIPFEGSWTAAQVAQHVILSAGGFVELLNGPVRDTDRDPEAYVDNLRSTFLNYDIKMQSPAFVIPETREYEKEVLMSTLGNIREGLLQSIVSLDTTKTCTAFEIPGSGYLTRAEGITFAIVHTERHAHQLGKIRQELEAAGN
jgi:hypothetical protein